MSAFLSTLRFCSASSRTVLSSLFMALCVSLSGASYADSHASETKDKVTERVPLDYSGWAVIKKQVLDPSAPEDKWVSMRGLTIADDGKKLRMMDGEKPTPYELELIVITYEETNTTVLKLALYEDGKDKAITYIWGQPGAERLGMNLRWMQAGFTLAEVAK